MVFGENIFFYFHVFCFPLRMDDIQLCKEITRLKQELQKLVSVPGEFNKKTSPYLRLRFHIIMSLCNVMFLLFPTHTHIPLLIKFRRQLSCGRTLLWQLEAET